MQNTKIVFRASIGDRAAQTFPTWEDASRYVESEASRTHETGMVSESEVVSGILQSYVLQEWSFNTGPGVGWVQVLKSAGREE